VDDQLRRRRALLVASTDTLRTLSPAATLERGYAVARTSDGRIVRDAARVSTGDALRVIVARGSLETRVEGTRPDGAEELLS